MSQSNAQIIATIGPATKDSSVIRALVEHHMDVVRLNFSWGTYEEHAGYIASVRQVATECARHIPIIQDLSGPRVQETTGHTYDVSASNPITEKDLRDLAFGISQKVDYVALSFVGSADDIEMLRTHMDHLGVRIPVIAKIERREALLHLDSIIASADAIMIARGDLGTELPLEQIPFVERDIIARCNKMAKPVIVATQMMLSMAEHPQPTRAEVTDVAYAITAGADAVMLSEETASGKYPVEAVSMMEKIILESETHMTQKSYLHL